MDPLVQALIAAGASFLAVTLVFGLALLACGRDAKARRSRELGLPTRAPAPALAEESDAFDPSLGGITMSKLAAATAGFCPDRIIGDGSFGFVYRAQMPDGRAVAVKRLAADAFQGFREFRAEVETLGRIRHPNLARILGYCAAGSDRLLIYELLERGSLDQWLHEQPHPPDRAPLPWSTRLRVARGVAAGLAFLHGDCNPSIIHRDIKASNVLLDAGFEARITDFGLARRVDSSRSHVSTQVAGTLGYMPPEYRDGVMAATAKADVYSFGVLLFEVAAGRRPNLPVAPGEGGKEVTLVRWARGAVEAGKGGDILDPLMEKGGVTGEGGAAGEGVPGCGPPVHRRAPQGQACHAGGRLTVEPIVRSLCQVMRFRMGACPSGISPTTARIFFFCFFWVKNLVLLQSYDTFCQRFRDCNMYTVDILCYGGKIIACICMNLGTKNANTDRDHITMRVKDVKEL